MLVTISSKNESNHANFTNFFQDVIQIKPNSYVCLINTSLITADNGTLINIGANQRLHIVYNIYNIIRLPLEAGEYTVSDWCDLMNANANTTTSHCIWGNRFEDNADGTITLEYFRKNTIPPGVAIPWYADTGFEPNYKENVYAAAFPYSYWRAAAGLTLPTSRPVGIGTDAPTNITGLVNNAGAAYNIVSHWGLTNADILIYYDYINQNRFDNNALTFSWNDFGGVHYFQTAPHMIANIYLQGNKYDELTNEYTLRNSQRKFYWEFKANKKVDTHLIYDDGTDTIVNTDLEYLPGDVFLCRQVGRDWMDGQPGGNNLSLSAVKYTNGSGLQLWIPFDIPDNTINNIAYNSQQGNSEYSGGILIREGVNILGTMTLFNLDAITYYKVLGVGMTKTGFRAGGGENLDTSGTPVSNELGQYIFDEYISDSGTAAVSQSAGLTQMPNGNALYLNRSTYERYSIFTRNGTQLLSANESIETALPSLIVFSFNIVPDGGATAFTILAEASVTVKIDPSTPASNIQIYDKAGVLQQFQMATHVIGTNTKYTMGIATFGDYLDTGTPRWKIYLQEADGTLHTHIVTPTVKNIQSITHIGGRSLPPGPIYDLELAGVFTPSAGAYTQTYVRNTISPDDYDFKRIRSDGFAVHYWKQQAGNPLLWDIYITDPTGGGVPPSTINLTLNPTTGVFDFSTATPSAAFTLQAANIPILLENESDYFNGNIWDFRFYQQSEYGTIADTTGWDATFTGVANYTISTANAGAVKPNVWYGVYDRESIFEPDINIDNEWNMLPRSTGQHFPNWYVDYKGGAGASEWFDFLNMNYSQPDGVQHNKFTSFNAILDVDSEPVLPLASSGVSIINANQTECRDARDILKMFADANIGDDDFTWISMQDASFSEFNNVAVIPGGHVVNATTDVVRNVNIDNLPQQSLDGNRKQVSKTIYQLPSVMEERTINERIHRSLTIPEKVKIPLNNPAAMYLNQLQIKITNEEGQEDRTLVSTSNVVIEISEYN